MTEPALPTMDVLEIVLAKLNEGDYKSAITAVEDPANDDAIKIQSMDFISLIAEYLTDEIAENKPALYSTTEVLLKRVSQKCSPPEVLYELMEKIRATKSDDVFTSILKTMQVAILRLPAKRARCLEWVFNTIIEYLDTIDLPDATNMELDLKEEVFLENDESMRRMLQLYITLNLFLKPIADHLNQPSSNIFFEVNLTQKNALICFMLRLMGKLFPLLHAEKNKNELFARKSRFPAGKSYITQVVEDMINLFVTLVKDPLFLLPYGEKRNNMKSKKRKHDSEEGAGNDCFLCNEPYLSEGLAMLFYFLFCEEMLPTLDVPLVYEKRYIFEMGLHHVVVILSSDRPVVYNKGIRFTQALLKVVNGPDDTRAVLSPKDLESEIHVTFCERFIRGLVHSKSEQSIRIGSAVLKDYIRSFKDDGPYIIISHMLKAFEDDSVKSFAINLYKDLANHEILSTSPGESPPPWYSGETLQDMLTKQICILKHGVKTDLLDNSYSIISALSALWVFLRADQTTKIGVWNYFQTLENQFLLKLRKALDLSRAHYNNELKAITDGTEREEHRAEISINTLNGAPPAVMSKEDKLELYNGLILRLDLLDLNLARVNGDIELMKRDMAKKVVEEMPVTLDGRLNELE